MENYHLAVKHITVSEPRHFKGNLFLLVIPEKYESIIFNTYHDSLLAGHQGPFQTVMTIRQKFFIHNLMNKVKRYIEACHICLKTKPK